MADKVFELNEEGIGELLKSEEIQAILTQYANEAAARSGLNCKIDTYVGKTRANASVGLADYESYKENLETNALLKSIGG